MLKRYVGIGFVLLIFLSLVISLKVDASVSGVVISQVQTRNLNGGSASEELVEVFNNSDVDIDITGWCVEYGASGSLEPTKELTCINHSSPDVGNAVILPARSYILLVSKVLSDNNPGFGFDFLFSSGLSDSARWIDILDSQKQIVDLVEWGSGESITAEGGKPANATMTTNLLQRKMVDETAYVDTDNNRDDFEPGLKRAVYSYGSIYEISDLCLNISGVQSILPDGSYRDTSGNCYEIIDVCQNIEGIQAILPEGFGVDAYDNCYSDVCLNLDGLQTSIPLGMEIDEFGSCVYHDECPNLDDIQSVVPEGYTLIDGNCKIQALELLINELLPNIDGSDEGNEFIEIYNPNDQDIDLANYRFKITSSSTKSYSFPDGSVIKADGYLAFYNSQIDFTLVNTTGSVELWTIDNQLIDSADSYSDPPEDQAWALIGGVWQYTNRPTFGLANQASSTVTVTQSSSTSALKPCGKDQYRNPETNRCKNIVSSVTELVPCKTGQYRSEETNRCRNIVGDVISYVPCAEGQERNPLTNRCRSVTATKAVSTLTPCKEGQERNPTTNRCRNIAASSNMPVADYALERLLVGRDDSYVWWSVAAIGVIAIIYAIWEWRFEMVNLANKLRNSRLSQK